MVTVTAMLDSYVANVSPFFCDDNKITVEFSSTEAAQSFLDNMLPKNPQWIFWLMDVRVN